MIQRSVGVAALGFVATLGFAAGVAAAPLSASAPAADAKPAIMLEYRVVRLEPGSLGALGVDRPEGAQLGITPLQKSGVEFDPDIAALEASGKARIVSRPMIMVQQGEKTGIDSTGPNGDFKLTMRVEAQGDGFALDLAIELSGAGVEPIAFQRDGIAPPASIVRCPEEGECLVVLIHATLDAPRSPDAR